MCVYVWTKYQIAFTCSFKVSTRLESFPDHTFRVRGKCFLNDIHFNSSRIIFAFSEQSVYEHLENGKKGEESTNVDRHKSCKYLISYDYRKLVQSIHVVNILYHLWYQTYHSKKTYLEEISHEIICLLWIRTRYFIQRKLLPDCVNQAYISDVKAASIYNTISFYILYKKQ